MASVVNTIGLIGLEGYLIKVQVKVIAGVTTMKACMPGNKMAETEVEEDSHAFK